MGRILLFLTIMVTGIFPVRPLAACSPPVFVQPEAIMILWGESERGADLLPAEADLLADYRRDRDRYLELYNTLYPCPQANESKITLTAGSQESGQEEMSALEEKWRAYGAPQDGPGMPETFYDVPAEDMLVHME